MPKALEKRRKAIQSGSKGKVGKDMAYAIATKQLQKEGVLKKGSNNLAKSTPKSKKK